MPSIRRPQTAVAAAFLLAAAVTACGPSHQAAAPDPSASAAASHAGLPHLPEGLPTALPTSRSGLKEWEQAYRDGGWRDWSKANWLHRAQDFVNPVIDGLWSLDRMRGADEDSKQVPADVPADRGRTDPAPAPQQASEVATPYHANAPAVGKLFFDSPEGPMVCSATVVEDPAHPGKSNLVWTAGHCVHAGKDGGWYRNIVFVPDYNDRGLSTSTLEHDTDLKDLAPYGVWWADWAATSDQWISTGSETGGGGSPYDFAVLHVTPGKGAGGTSLQETVGAAMPVWFDAPSPTAMTGLGAWGYPEAAPYDGQRMYDCQGKPGRLSLDASAPTEYRVGCSMTGGASGGGWFTTMPDGRTALVSDTSIGPEQPAWLAGPRLGAEAKAVYDGVSRKFA
jgi:hypothetical protein